MISRATARRSTSRRARSRSAGFDSDRDGRRRPHVFEIECGKGTYVRSLARDMGRDLGCFGHIAELRRVEVEPFTRRRPRHLDDAGGRAFAGRGGRRGMPMPADRFAAHRRLARRRPARRSNACRRCAVTDDAAARIRLGNPVIVRGRDAPVEAEEACATARGKLVAIGAIEAGMFKPKRVFAG